ncbi:spore germination protein [Paenibacillus spongiae]|uniref:Spore germination protein n=1 Tax=Paenibacillus spongiae TaxID=2909671 RepID=A0ABY5S6Y3_9BACL|nr:spore germination protein [Paenibacillus spongiae]UVI28585.1 spore germination protein [Paenibacillus spongiae]
MAASLHTSLLNNLGQIRETFGNSTDIVIRELRIGGGRLAAIIFADGLVDDKIVNEFIIESLLQRFHPQNDDERSQDIIQALKESLLVSANIRDIADFERLYDAVLTANIVILLDGLAHGIAVEAPGWKDRAVSEPVSESVIRGPQEAFTETLRTNTALIRRKIKNPNLWLETKPVGRMTKTDIGIMYIKGLANDGIIEEVRKRLDRIKIDGILESGYIEELIQDEPYSPFPTVYNSERPDVIAAELLEGKVAILVDGTPFVLVVPALLVSFLHASEDYYHRADISSLVRILRYIGIFIALLAPSLYVAITTYHQEMLPTALLLSLAAQREGIPFPAFIEALMMEIAFEILREAGLRMPRVVGPAVSIVGTLVIGQAAVEAGVVSAAMVIVVSVTAICSLAFPSYSLVNSIRMLRFPLMVVAATFGLFGIIIGLIALVLHLSSLRTFGIPYMSPFAPLIPSDQKDALIRLPHWALFSRPRLINQNNVIREDTGPPVKPKQRS